MNLEDRVKRLEEKLGIDGEQREPKVGDVYQNYHNPNYHYLIVDDIHGGIKWVCLDGKEQITPVTATTYLGKFHEVFTRLPSREAFYEKEIEVTKTERSLFNISSALYDWLVKGGEDG